MLDKKQITAIFLIEFKKQWKELTNINNAFGSGTANEHIVQWWFKKFCKGDESHEDEGYSGYESHEDEGYRGYESHEDEGSAATRAMKMRGTAAGLWKLTTTN